MLEGKIRNPDASVIKTEKQSITETIDQLSDGIL